MRSRHLGPSYHPIALIILLIFLLAPATLAAKSRFSPQSPVDFIDGDQWEPAIAADGYGHVYILYPQYVIVPKCPNCSLPSMEADVGD